MLESPDLGLFHLHGSKFDALADRDATDDIDDLFTIFDRSFLQLFKSAAGRSNGIIDIVK